MRTRLLPFLADLWRLVSPYWSSQERWIARGLLAAITVLNLGLVYINVLLNDWNRRFYDALQEKDQEVFLSELGIFCALAAAFILVAVYQTYLNQMLQIRWRRWLTERSLTGWLGMRAYYRIELEGAGTDNPDQRISEDLRSLVDDTLSLGFGLLRQVVTLVSFVGILWTLSGPLAFTLGGTEIVIPGYMVWAALVYSIAGTLITHWIGRPLIGLNFQQQRVEADFRFGLIRLRENAEAIALYRGEADEHAGLSRRFEAIQTNWWAIMRRQKQLSFFSVGFAQVAVVFPFLVASPRFFSGAIQLGGLMQISSAFGQVQGAMSWFIDAYTRLAAWKATVDRLRGFGHAVEGAHAGTADGPQAQAAPSGDIVAENLRVALPDGRALIEVPALRLRPGERALLTGPSGSGKSTLFRALAGIWPFGSGTVRVPPEARSLFLPQRPYLPIGPLRDVVSFPVGAGRFSDDDIRAALAAVHLAPLAERLDETAHWGQRLSPGEQQRLAFARALLIRPDWLFLDEATSALDEPTEQALYALLGKALPNSAIVSIAHRPTVAAFHDRRLTLAAGETGPAVLAGEPGIADDAVETSAGARP